MIIINNKNYLEVKDVMELLKITHSRVAGLISEGKLKAFKPSPRKTYFSEEMIEKYLKGE
jgi:hypothetical protein